MLDPHLTAGQASQGGFASEPQCGHVHTFLSRGWGHQGPAWGRKGSPRVQVRVWGPEEQPSLLRRGTDTSSAAHREGTGLHNPAALSCLPHHHFLCLPWLSPAGRQGTAASGRSVQISQGQKRKGLGRRAGGSGEQGAWGLDAAPTEALCALSPGSTTRGCGHRAAMHSPHSQSWACSLCTAACQGLRLLSVILPALSTGRPGKHTSCTPGASGGPDSLGGGRKQLGS